MRSLYLLAAGCVLSCARAAAPEFEQAAVREAPAAGAPVQESVCPPAAPDFGDRFIAAAKAIRPALVSIRWGSTLRRNAVGSSLEGTPLEPLLRGLPMPRQKLDRRGVGSGVVIDDAGNILTSNHVVEGASTMRVKLLNGRELSATLVGSDAKTDLAVIKASGAGVVLQPAQFGDSNTIQLGQWLMASGVGASLQQTVYAGMVNALGRGSTGLAEFEDFIQTDAASHPSASGGPLLDRAGRVVGINAAPAAQSDGSPGTSGFAVPINMARNVAEQLLAHGRVVRGNIGVYVGNVSDELAHSFGFRGSGGALVQDVAPEGPGARAGIEPGDIVMERNGVSIANAAELRNGVAALAPGSKTQLRVFREGKQRTFEVEVEELPVVATTSGALTGEQPRWGMELSEITPELRDRLDLGAAQGGAVIVQVKPNSAADDAGLRAGDLIAGIGEYEVRDADQARRLLLTAKAPVRLRVVHDGRGSFTILNGSE